MTDIYTLFLKETKRFFRVWKQTLVPPVVTTFLYLLIFGKFLGEKIDIGNIPYINFIFPGLLMMAVIMASYNNVISSFFHSKMNKSLEELFVSPMNEMGIVLGFVLSAVLRGLIVGGLVTIVGLFMTNISVAHIGYTAVFLVLSTTLFALLGLLNSIFAKTFDGLSMIPNFIITPLVYLGGVFYSIDILPGFWRTISEFNPILYMVNGLRYGFIGQSDVNVFVSMLVIVAFIVILGVVNIILLKKGTGIRS